MNRDLVHGQQLDLKKVSKPFETNFGLQLLYLKEHYRIGFASKKVAGSVSTLCNPPFT